MALISSTIYSNAPEILSQFLLKGIILLYGWKVIARDRKNNTPTSHSKRAFRQRYILGSVRFLERYLTQTSICRIMLLYYWKVILQGQKKHRLTSHSKREFSLFRVVKNTQRQRYILWSVRFLESNLTQLNICRIILPAV